MEDRGKAAALSSRRNENKKSLPEMLHTNMEIKIRVKLEFFTFLNKTW